MDGNPFLKSAVASSELDTPAADNKSVVHMDQYSQSLTQQNSLSLKGEAEPDDHGEETEGHGRRLISSGNDTEENVTIISESMTVTSADEEKLLLLNRNTDLRRLNKELMKLNEEWDHIYRSTTMGLQEKIHSLQQEVVGLNQHNERLLMKLEHEQSKREYYEQTLLQELRKNQHLQEYVHHLEGKIHRSSSSSSTASERPAGNGVEVSEGLYELPSKPPLLQYKGSSHSPPPLEPPGNGDRKQGHPRQGRSRQDSSTSMSFKGQADMMKEVQELKDQLETLKCQTQIYEADYQTEHKDRERMKNENSKLRRKEEELRQQMALQQEQLKVYEDDFRKERSDKQILQKLLLKKAGPTDPVLVHRCNNVHERSPGGRQGSARRSGCAKHCERHGHKASECPRVQRPHQHQDAEVQASPFSIDCH
ncbi:uncharacterized protein LOC121295931 isoform X2 [Polyodon spathula]|uniref:uncharacterized protein LOC121295931 isoform X2 n=1 Tax=Polyodon spathula TaxID=7913 RepID=UPI001B7E67B5|nr:uncharacterized protein LOC121295931 isoform X2 [Polyodon spathula]